jgi:hypothetical protein
MNRTFHRDLSCARPSERTAATLRGVLAEQYPELSEQSVVTALDQATRAAAALLNNAGDPAGGTALVAALARDRLDAQRERRAASASAADPESRSGPLRVSPWSPQRSQLKTEPWLPTVWPDTWRMVVTKGIFAEHRRFHPYKSTLEKSSAAGLGAFL